MDGPMAGACYSVWSSRIAHEFLNRFRNSVGRSRPLFWRKPAQRDQRSLASSAACRCSSECRVLCLVDETEWFWAQVPSRPFALGAGGNHGNLLVRKHASLWTGVLPTWV